MNEIQIFKNAMFGDIRIIGEADGPWFCAADVCAALEYKNGRDAVAKHVDECDVAKRDIIDSLGREQSATFINESGLYALIFGSKLPSAKAFKRWVTSEVLPEIRKTGGYGIATPKSFSEALMLAAEQQRKIEEQQKQIEADRPKTIFADAVVGSKSSCLIGELAKILSQNGYTIGQNRLFRWLREHRYLGSTGEYYNIPMQRYIEQGLFEVKKTTHSENEILVTTTTTKVTGKGQQYFINLFLDRGEDGLMVKTN